MASFGTPLSSIPNTSYLNVSSPISSLPPDIKADYVASLSSSSSASKGMDPFSAIATIASAGLGLVGASQSAKATEAAAAQASEATEKAAKFRSRTELAKDIGGFGFDYFTQRYNTGAGEAANQFNRIQNASQMATFEARNPDQINLRSAERFGRAHDYAAQLAAAMPGYQPPIGMFG